MSVTFWIQDTPHELVECLCVTDPAPWEEEQGHCPCCFEHPGKMKRPVWPDMNLANGNARGLLEALGVDTEFLAGEWQHHQLRGVMDRVERLLTDDAYFREWYPLREGYHKVGPGGCEIHDPGQDVYQVNRYLQHLNMILEKAWIEGKMVHWG